MSVVAHEYEVTSVGVNPAKDRAYRMRMYFATMTLRMLCVVSLFWVRGLWLILVAVGAVVLPYLAVLIANAVSNAGGEALEVPAPLELTAGDAGAAVSGTDTAAPLIVVDDPGENRATSANHTNGAAGTNCAAGPAGGVA